MALDLCKYYKKQEYVSYNDGLTWQPLDNYEKGELYESHSSSCGAGVFQYQWVQINNGYICDGKDRYTREIYQYSEDGQVWYNVWPTQYRKGTLVESNSPFCDNAANGQYSSGDTDPTSGDTEDCPPGYFWNGTECECNGEYIGGVCVPCPDNMRYNKTTQECECIEGHLDNYGNCVICPKYELWDDVRKECYCPTERDEYGNCKSCPPNSTWNERQNDCICHKWYEKRGDVCVYVDPLKIVKCEESNGILTSSDVMYYESGWTVISYTVGDCIIRIEYGAFNGQTQMTAVTIPSSVVAVGALAFGNCKSLTSITFPSTLSELGNSAFKGCEKLQTVTFGGDMPSTLNNAMFSGCTALESASWLDNITSIGNNAFAQCTSLTSVTFSPNLTTIGYNAFNGCRNIGNIVIPSATTGIDACAFKNCSSLTNVIINSQNIAIGNNVFENCTSLTAVSVNSSGVTMGNNVFNGCENLVKITFTSPTPFAITSGFFDNTNECLLIVPCESLQAYKTTWSEYEDRITCTDTGVYYRWVDTSGTYCEGTDAYTREKQQSTTNGITWTDTGVYRPITFITHYSPYCGYSDEVTLTVTNEDGYTRYYEPCSQSTLKLIAVYNNGNYMAADCDSDTTLTTATTKTYSTSYTAMTNAEIGNCITSIGTEAFYSCYSLRGIVIPNSVTSIGNQAFRGCTGLTSIDIPNSVTSIGVRAFYQCTGLRSIDIPDSVTSIGNEAFSRCSNLTSCTIGNSVTSIGYEAFYACYNLTSITINATTPPALVNTSAFNNTNNCPIYVPCESVEAYKSASDWSSYANRIQCIQPTFEGKFRAEYSDSSTYSAACDSSTELTTATTRAHSTSYTAMTSAEIGDCVTSIGYQAFASCSGLTTCTIGSGVTSIGDVVFAACINLTSVTIPNSVTSIGQFAFYNCSGLTSCTIGSGVTSISNQAFQYCSGLTSVTVNATTPPTLGSNVFGNTNSNFIIYVPSVSVNAYKSASGWSTYADRIQAIPNS